MSRAHPVSGTLRLDGEPVMGLGSARVGRMAT